MTLSPEPALLARRLATLRANGTLHEDELALVAPLLACEAPGGWLLQRPRLIHWLARTRFLDEERPALSFEEKLTRRVEALAPTDVAGLDRLLRLFRRREFLRISLRDLTRRAPLRVVSRELAHLADALLVVATRFLDRHLARRFDAPLGDRFAIVAMGKHGGRELNYSSDVDVLFVTADDAARDQATQLARAVIRALSETTAHGHAFRVDADLRPWGRAGPLTASVEEMERYYERAGQTWERAALVKARPCAGGLDLGNALIERVRPFVWRRSMDLATVEAVSAMKRRIDRARELSSADDVKLGRGGIREVEFFVQALLLLHGGRQPRLRQRSTLDALDGLLYAGLLPSADHDALSEAYVFLRDVEHRLQIPWDRQTHQLPAAGDEEHRSALALRMGFDGAAALDEALARHRDAVHERFAALLAAAKEERPHPAEVDVALAADEADATRLAALAALGFDAPDVARNELERLARQADGAFGPRGRERHPGLDERLLAEMARSPAPDLALSRFARLTGSLWAPGDVTALLASNAATARLLVLLFSSSEALTRDFTLHPELLDALVRSDAAATSRTAEDLRAELSRRLADCAGFEARAALLRRFRHEETLRIGLHDLAGRLRWGEVSAQLTRLGEVLLSAALDLARAEVQEKWGEPETPRLVVLGLGSLGGAELQYESDLDLVFVHDARGTTSGGPRGTTSAGEWAARVAQRLLSQLTLPMTEGVLYRVDARLRPSGTQGPLVTSFEAFRDYHVGEQARGAALWERQALLRARFVAGDAALGARIDEEVLEPAVAQPLPDDAGRQIAEMRRRLDDTTEDALRPKKSPGGLLDVEFAAQFLLLRAHLRIPSTRDSLEGLRAVGHLSADDARDLLDAYDDLRRVESRLRLMYGHTDVWVPTDGPVLRRIARQLGDAGPDAGPRLVRELRRVMGRTRALFDALVR